MPILTPTLGYQFLNILNKNKPNSSLEFFLYFIKKASRNLYRNYRTAETIIRFKKNLKSDIALINKNFGCNFKDENAFNNPKVKDYYKYFLDHIDSKLKTKIPNKLHGSYIGYEQVGINRFFQPYLNSDIHSWFFTSSPVAILVLKKANYEYLKLINIEIDIISASGFAIVLVCKLNLGELIDNYFYEFIVRHPFYEILFFNDQFCFDTRVAETPIDEQIKNYDLFFSSLLNVYDQFFGYFYFYSKYVPKNATESIKSIEELKNKPRFKSIFYFEKDIPLRFGAKNSNKIQPFIYSKDGFKDENIFINICNVPLYLNENESDFLISEYCETGFGYISTNDFLNYEKKRVKIIYVDKNDSEIYLKRYINFDDIHYINPDIFVSTLAQANINSHDLYSQIKMNKGIKIKNENDQKISDLYLEVSTAYKNNIRKLNLIQEYTARQACFSCFFDDKYSTNKYNGIIYQVQTGEGKSCIIQIIAAVFAKMGKTVHITSSNITLSNRDYYDSYKFFKNLGLKSAVLLHYNELPYVSFNDSKSNDIEFERKSFPDEFFGENLFKNSINMNLSVCGVDFNDKNDTSKADIIFSTFLNFECLYLKMMELCPTKISSYFSSCSLIIDEADSILLDEITNGTILSRTLKSNASEVLKFVYEKYVNKVPKETVFNLVKEKWSECSDLTIEDIDEMFYEINLVNQDEYVDGRKYSIETFFIEEKMDTAIVRLEKKVLNMIERSKLKVKQFFSFNKKNKKQKAIKKDENKKSEKKTIKEIIPFDYDHKGILEPNKEFSGFVQQFIGIKEMLNDSENQNIEIKDISLNYLFISHPIFVKLYSGVCGLTGTIGNKYDRQLLYEHYKLLTKEIPRQKMNLRINLPIILCDNIEERNKKIVKEIIHFHKKDIPVLAIFEDLNEISSVLYLLIKKKITMINIFDGKDEQIKPDIIAGVKGAISLGTNMCGRGTNVRDPFLPLHVIVTYFSTNSRVMEQAFGRTARQGKEGTVRIICLKKQFFTPIREYNKKELETVLNDYQTRNDLQIEFIESIRKTRKWIFSGKVKSQELSDDIIKRLRKTKINVNRIKVCNFRFPICMSVDTYLMIQAQKIFSLYNCPNCEYTWILFQKYLREMVLESWSIFIDRSYKEYHKEKRKITYSDYLKIESKNLMKSINKYLPDDPSKFDILPTFLNIFKEVIKTHEIDVMSIFPNFIQKGFKEYNKMTFCSFQVGFKPYTLIDESGAKINTINGEDQDQHYISDPELKYIRKEAKGKSFRLSITEKIDDLFNWICRKINDVIGSYVGLRFFLRRTLVGCEFGVCFDWDLEKLPEMKNNYNCIVDQDPLLLFTINVKSMAPILAGILIIGLVYIASIAKSIAEWISAFPIKITKELVKKTLIQVSKVLIKSQIEQLCDTIISSLIKILFKQVLKMDQYREDVAKIFKIILQIISPKDMSFVGDKIGGIFNAKVKMSSGFGQKYIKGNLPFEKFFKIGLLLLLCFSSFLMNFYYKRQELKYDVSKAAESYDENQNTELAYNENKELIENAVVNDEPYD